MQIIDYIKTNKELLSAFVLTIILAFFPSLIFFFVLSLLSLQILLVKIYCNKTSDILIYSTFFTIDTMYMFVGRFTLFYFVIYFLTVTFAIYLEYENNKISFYKKLELMIIYTILKIITIFLFIFA